MADAPVDPLAFLFVNPALQDPTTGGAHGLLSSPTTGDSSDSSSADTGGGFMSESTPPPSAVSENSANGVYSPPKPNYLETWNTGMGTIQKMMRLAATPDDSEEVKKRPSVFPQVSADSTSTSSPDGTDTTTGSSGDQGYYNTKRFLQHGQDFVDENDRVVGQAGTIGDYDKSGEVTVRGTEFGEVDNPSRGGYTEPGWNKGAWGDDISGENTEGVALPAHVLSKYGDWHHGNFSSDFNSKYDIVITNPKTGQQVLSSLKDAGPGEKTGAGIDLLWGTRAKLGLPANSSYDVKYSIVPKGSAKQKAGDEVDGHKPIHPTISLHDTDQDGVSLPHSVVKNSIGDFENDPGIMDDMLKGYYKVALSSEDGERSALAPIIATSGSDLSGHALHLSPKTARQLGTGGQAKVGYQLVDQAGDTIPIRGYHPDSMNRGNWDDHIGPNRKIPGTSAGNRFTFQKYGIPVAEGGYLKPDGTTDYQLADRDKALDRALT